jgi:hypothetical protein
MPENEINSNGNLSRRGSGAPGILDIEDLNTPLQDVYRVVLKSGELSIGEAAEVIKDANLEELKIYLNLLAQLGYVEKYQAEGVIRYRVMARARDKTTLPNEIWDSLEK